MRGRERPSVLQERCCLDALADEGQHEGRDRVSLEVKLSCSRPAGFSSVVGYRGVMAPERVYVLIFIIPPTSRKTLSHQFLERKRHFGQLIRDEIRAPPRLESAPNVSTHVYLPSWKRLKFGRPRLGWDH